VGAEEGLSEEPLITALSLEGEGQGEGVPTAEPRAPLPLDAPSFSDLYAAALSAAELIHVA
jgi:hypothetical protein